MTTTRDELLRLLSKHRLHVKQSPGVGAECQQYAIAVLDDLLNDLSLLSDSGEAAEPVAYQCRHRDARKRPGSEWEECDREVFDDISTRKPVMWESRPLYTHPVTEPAVGVPDGWALVPRELNARMLDVAFMAFPRFCCDTDIDKLWEAMLAASPAPPAATEIPANDPSMQPGYTGDAEIAKAFRVESTTAALDTEIHFVQRVIRHARTFSAAATAPQGEAVVGYAPFGDGGYGEAVALLHHAGPSVSEVKSSVLAKAQQEGFKDSADERLLWLGWDIRPLKADTSLAASARSQQAGGGHE